MKKTNEQLVAEFQAGDESALDALLEQNQGLICQVAWKAANTSIEEFDDLYQELQIVFCRAAERFDLDRGFKFSTYAVSSMKYEAMTRHKASKVSKRSASVVSIHASVGNDSTLIDFLGDDSQTPDEIASFNSEVDLVHEAMRRLDERSREIVRLRMLNYTMQEIGEKFGVTRERVNQLQRIAIAKIQKWCNPAEPVEDQETPEQEGFGGRPLESHPVKSIPTPSGRQAVVWVVCPEQPKEPVFQDDPRKSTRRVVRENEGLIIRMFLDGKLPREIGDVLGVHNNTIRDRLRKLGIYYDCRTDRRKPIEAKTKFDRYRQRLRERGCCSICPKPRVAESVYCEYHREKRRSYHRAFLARRRAEAT